MSDKKQSLQDVQSLMKQHGISLAELQAFIKEKPASESSPLLIQLLAYLGSVFVLCGISVFVGMEWENMNSITRVLATLGSGFVAFVMAILILNDGRYEKLITPLFVISALLEIGGLFVFLDEYFSSSGHWEHAAMLVFSAVGLQFGLLFLSLRRAALLFVAVFCCACFLGSFLENFKVDHEIIVLIVGLGLVVTACIAQQTKYSMITPLWHFFGGFMFLHGLFELVEKSFGEIIYIAANIGLVYLSIMFKSRTLLFVSIVSLFSYMSYTAYEHFVDSVGLSIALIALGLLLFGLSALGVKINQKYIKSN